MYNVLRPRGCQIPRDARFSMTPSHVCLAPVQNGEGRNGLTTRRQSAILEKQMLVGMSVNPNHSLSTWREKVEPYHYTAGHMYIT